MRLIDKMQLSKMLRFKRDQFYSRSFGTSPQLLTLEEKPTIRDRFDSKRSEAQIKMEEKRRELRLKQSEAKTRMQMGLLGRFLNYLASYGEILEKAFPDTIVKTYRLFSMGTSALIRDTKTYIYVQTVLGITDHNKAFRTFTRRELEVYHSLPQDLARVAPVLLLSAFPFAQNVVFPLALLHPQRFLSTQFWTNIQKDSASLDDIKKRRGVHLFVIKSLQEKLPLFRNEDLNIEARRNIGRLLSGSHPSPDEMLQLLPLFSPGGVYHLNNLSRKHAMCLARLHGLPSIWPWQRRRLMAHGRLLLAMDWAIAREGIRMMDNDQLAFSCAIRGIERGWRSEMLDYLQSWSQASVHVEKDNVSMLLHLPLFLTYNRSIIG